MNFNFHYRHVAIEVIPLNIVGIIVEYNPLHNGHAYHFQSAKEVTNADACVAVMSGHFLQRGEPAVVNKWARTEMALRMGIDLVVELPVAYATQNSEWFAFGAVSALHKLGNVKSLCFGSESGNIEKLMRFVPILLHESREFQQHLKQMLKKGNPYPKAFSLAVEHVAGNDECADTDIGQPNNILGLNYLLALQRLNSPIVPYTIRRTKAGYHQQDVRDASIASATAIRKMLFESGDLTLLKNYVPSATYEMMRREIEAGRGPNNWERFFPLLRYALLTTPESELAQIFDVGEGIEHRLKEKILTAPSVEAFIHAVKTKRYTWNRIQRILLNTLMKLSKKRMRDFRLGGGVPYLRILGFNETGQKILHEAKKTIPVPVITNLSQARPPMLELDVQASMLYALAYSGDQTEKQLKREFHQAPIRL